MPSSSKAQQKFMGMVHSLQKGDMKSSDASSDVKKAADSMSKKDAKDYASTSHKGLPNKVKQEILNKLKEYGGKMGKDHLGGDDIPTKKKGGLRDFDGYDNVDYNRDMPMDEVSSADAYKISRMLGTAQQSTQDFIDDNKIDVKKIESYIRNLSAAKKGIIKDIINGSTDNRLSTIKKNLIKQVKESIDEACWKGYKEVGGKLKNGKQVPNCVPESVEEEIEEGGLPQNWMAGRVSDYHTKLRGKRKKYDDTNFAKMNTGQPDIPDEETDDEIVNETFDNVLHLKLLTKAMKEMPGSERQKQFIRQLNKIRKPAGMKPLKETAIEEYASRLTNAYILDDESILKGTPEPKDAININEASALGFLLLTAAMLQLTSVLSRTGVFGNTTIGDVMDSIKNANDRRIVRQIARKLKDDQEIKDFLKLPPSEQKGKWRKLIATKLQPNEMKLLNIIYKKHFEQNESIEEEAKRDYKDEYKKFQSSDKSKKYRAELNKYNRDKNTYGNGDGKDASHKGGKIVGFESEAKNRGRKEKSRLKKKK